MNSPGLARNRVKFRIHLIIHSGMIRRSEKVLKKFEQMRSDKDYRDRQNGRDREMVREGERAEDTVEEREVRGPVSKKVPQ